MRAREFWRGAVGEGFAPTSTVVAIVIKLIGHAAIWNALSDDRRRHPKSSTNLVRERFDRGAFDYSLSRGREIKALWQHDDETVLASTVSDDLRVWTDSAGLAFEIILPAWAVDTPPRCAPAACRTCRQATRLTTGNIPRSAASRRVFCSMSRCMRSHWCIAQPTRRRRLGCSNYPSLNPGLRYQREAVVRYLCSAADWN